MSEEILVNDAFGNTLTSWDSVQLTQELKVKWTKITLKKGTKVKNIRLTDDAEEVECNTPEIKGLVLKTCFLKKVD